MNTENFVDKYGVWNEAQREAANELQKTVTDNDIKTIRVSFCDQHGILRGKTIMAEALENILFNGCALTSTLLLKDTSHRTAYPVWKSGAGLGMPEMTGACDFLIVPDPVTFRILPWANKSAWVLCDCYFSDGSPVPFSTRRIFKQQLSRLSDCGYDYLSGIELEFSLYKLDDARLNHADCTQPGSPPDVSPLTHGFQYLTEIRYDRYEPVLDILGDAIRRLGLPLNTMEVEFGPSQVEMTFAPVAGCESADNVVLARNAIKQVSRRHGYHATFMCRPGLPNSFASGWHLHQSLVDSATGENRFMPDDDSELLSATGKCFLAGLLEHAKECTVFSTPTINGYKRYRPFTLAPNHIVWGKDNRGAMLRVTGAREAASVHLENRAGDPAANPYLYMSSQIIAGMDGIQRGLPLPERVDAPYDENRERLPRNLFEATAYLKHSKLFRDALGDVFVDYYIAMKEHELNRFLSEEVTDWEHKEYFETF